MLAQLVGNVLAVLRTVKWDIEWVVKSRAVTVAATYIYRGCCDMYISVATTFMKLVVPSNGYVTCGIARLQVIATCCESTHVRGVSCNVSGIWNVVVT